MISSFAYLILSGLFAAFLVNRLKLPRIIGMLLVGILLGPFVLNVLDPSLIGISTELRKIALIIILIKAGLSLDLASLKKVGRPAVLMSFLPALFEIGAFVLLGPVIFHISMLEAAIIGAVLGAVSPAVVVPRMVQLMDEKYGTEEGIPQMILAGASLDDVFVIVLFSTFIQMAQGSTAQVMDFINIPISIIVGITVGAVFGWVLAKRFEWMHAHQMTVRNSTKVIILLGFSFLMITLEDLLDGTIAMSGLLAVMSMSCSLKSFVPQPVAKRMADKYGKLWIGAEVVLFVLVGAAVDIRYTLTAGLPALLMILFGLLIRSIGTWLCLLGTHLNTKERIFTVISYLPKATVQAAIGGIPLALGLPCGTLTLSVAVLSILITAPLGAFGMDLSYKKLLKKAR